MSKIVYWNLYENDVVIGTFPSHTKAKKAMHKKVIEADMGGLNVRYKVKKAEEVERVVKMEPKWRTDGFKSLHEYNEWLNDLYDDIRGGFV